MKKMKLTSSAFVLFLMFTQGSLAEQQPIMQLKKFLADTKALMTDFKQVSLDEYGNIVQTSYGVFYLQRPGRFRWEYRQPFEQQIVSNSEKIWFYDQDLEQVTVKKVDQSLGAAPALLLSGDISLEDNFTLQVLEGDDDLQWIKLLPKNEQSSFNYVLIGMNNEVLGGMELSDTFGQLTRIYFSNVKIKTQLDPSLFKFIIPEGVDVFEDAGIEAK